ncbi:MAG: hypothetical protein ACTSP9_01725 [Promethearchaeota archaeon]
MKEKEYQCFVIMPFSKSSNEHTEDYWTNHYNNLLKPLIETNPEISTHRVNVRNEDILNQIITNLITSPIVVAELTDHDPKVFWELGVRQSFKHNTITIIEEDQKLPFDISSKATLFYNPRDKSNMDNFKNRFKSALKDCINNPEKTDSYVLETIFRRGTLYEILQYENAKRRLEALLYELKRNLRIWNKMFPLTDIKKGGMHARFFRTAALELLITTRYLDMPTEYYVSSELLFSFFYQMNNSFFLNTHYEVMGYLRAIELTKRLKKYIEKIELVYSNICLKAKSFPYMNIKENSKPSMAKVFLKP